MVCHHTYGMLKFIYTSVIFIYFYILSVDNGMSILSWYVDIYLLSWYTHIYFVFIYRFMLTENNIIYMNSISILT